MLKHKPTMEFILIGGGAAIVFRSLFEVFFSDFNALVFFFGFGFIGMILGIYYSTRFNLFVKPYLNRFIIPATFMLCGVAYSMWLHITFATSSLEDYDLFLLFIPGAVGSFVYIFCVLYLSLKNTPDVLIKSLTFSLLVFLYLLIADTSITTAIAIGLVSYLIALALIYITILYHYADYVGNITISVILLSGAYILVFPIFGFAGVLFFPLLNIYFIVVLIKRYNTRNKTEEFKKKVTTSFEWLLALPTIFLNATLLFFPFSIIPYIVITNTLMKSNQLSRSNFKRAVVLGVFSLVVYSLFYLGYSTIFFDSHNATTTILEIAYWGFVGLVGSIGLGYSLIYKGGDEKNIN